MYLQGSSVRAVAVYGADCEALSVSQYLPWPSLGSLPGCELLLVSSVESMSFTLERVGDSSSQKSALHPVPQAEVAVPQI